MSDNSGGQKVNLTDNDADTNDFERIIQYSDFYYLAGQNQDLNCETNPRHSRFYSTGTSFVLLGNQINIFLLLYIYIHLLMCSSINFSY